MRVSGPAPRPRRPFFQRPGRENAQSFTEYATVTALFLNSTSDSILVIPDGKTDKKWIPRRRLETSSRIKSAGFERGKPVTFQVELQFALDEGVV